MGQRIDLSTFEAFARVANQWWASTIMQTRIATPGEGEDTFDSVEMTSPDGGAIPIDLTRLEGFGDVGIPPQGTSCIVLRKSDGGVAMSLMQTATRPTDGKAGDRGLYCAVLGTTLFLRADDGRIEIKQASGSSMVLGADGSITLTDKDGNTAILDGDTLTVQDVVKTKHFSGDGSAPSAFVGAALGSGGTATITGESTDAALQVDFQAGSMGTAPGELCTITFAKKYARAPKVAYAPLDDIAAGPTMAGKFFFATSQSPTETKLVISTTATANPSDFFSLTVLVTQ